MDKKTQNTATVIFTDNPPFNQKAEIEKKEVKPEADSLYGGNPAVMADAIEQMKNVRKLLKDRLKGVKDTAEAIITTTAEEKVRLQGSKETKVPSLKPYTEAADVKDRAELSRLVEKAKKEKKLFKIGRSMKEGFRYTFLIEGMAKEEAKPEFKVGSTVKITSMAGEPEYTGKVGKITKIDDAGQLHGTWGGLALIPGDDKFELVTVINHETGKVEENKKVKEALTEEEKEVSTPHFELMNNETGKIMAFFKGSKTAFESAVEIGKTIHGKNGGYRKEDKFVVIEKKHPSGVSLFSSSDGDMRDALMLSSMELEEAFFFDGKEFGTKLTSFEQAKELGKGAKWPVAADKKYFDMYHDKGFELFVKGTGKDRIITIVRNGDVVNAYDINDKLVVLEKVMPTMKAMPKMEGAPEEHHHEEEHKDEGEYDEEGDMAKSDLQIMADAALELHGMLADEENLPEWVQAKITLATDYIDTARDYMKAKKAGKDFPEPKEDEETDTENIVELKPLEEAATGSWGKEVITLQEFATALEKLGRDDIDVFPILKGIAAGTHRAFVKHEGKDTTITVLRGDVVEMTLTSKKEEAMAPLKEEKEEEHFWTIVSKKVGDVEKVEKYDDFDDVRADFKHIIQETPEEFEYAVMQEVSIIAGVEEIDILGEFKEGELVENIEEALVEPKKGESEAEYVSRFMGSKRANKDFPNQKQRAAVAYSKFNAAKGKKEDMEIKDTKFFPGEDGDTEANMFIEEHGIEDFDLTWNDAKGGYTLSWEVKLDEAKKPEGKKEVISTTLTDEGVLKIFLGNSILAEIEDGKNTESFIKDTLHGMGYIWNKDGTVSKKKEEGKKPLEEKKLKEDTTILSNLNEFEPWSGAVSTWELIVEANKVDALDFMLEDLYPEGITSTELNDLLWFESDWVLDMLGIDESEVEAEEDKEEGKEEAEGKKPEIKDELIALNDLDEEPVVFDIDELEEGKHAHDKKEKHVGKEEMKESSGSILKEVQDFISKTVGK